MTPEIKAWLMEQSSKGGKAKTPKKLAQLAAAREARKQKREREKNAQD